MGVSLFSKSACNCAPTTEPSTSKFGNPDPGRFEILRHDQFSRHSTWTVVEVHYPDAKNYEGKKIMVYRAAFSKIAEQKYLDPHFCDDGAHLSPFARFEPTEEGWRNARRFCKGACED